MQAPPRVLVVQSRGPMAAATRERLAAEGFEPVVAGDGERGVAHLDLDPPDAVVLDLTLPVLDGWYVLARVGGRPGRPVIVTYSPRPQDADRASRLGSDACVSDVGDLVPALRRLLSTLRVG